MVLASIFARAGVVVIGLLLVCWKRYWTWLRRRTHVGTSLDRRPDVFSLADRMDREQYEGDCEDKENAWYTRYHCCLLLTPIFLGLAAFCAVLSWTEGWSFWAQIPLSALSGALVLLGSGWLGYGPVREYILPLEDFVLPKK